MASENHINLPANAEVAGKVVDSQAQQAMRKIDRGLIGVLFGTRDHVPFNVAAAVVVIAVLAIGYLMLWYGFAVKRDEITTLSGLVTLFGGYLFGKASKD